MNSIIIDVLTVFFCVTIVCLIIILALFGRRYIYAFVAALAIFIVLLMAQGCAPYMEVGAGYAFDNGDYYDIENEGAIGIIAVGSEFRTGPFSYCEYRHRSLLNKKPEVATDDVVCMRRLYFGGQQ